MDDGIHAFHFSIEINAIISLSNQSVSFNIQLLRFRFI